MKITKYLAMMAAVVGMTAACQKEEFVTFHADDVVAPVLKSVEDIVVTVDNKDKGTVEFSWDAADFGVKTQIFYSLDMKKGEKSVSLFSGVSGTKSTVSMESINNKAFNDLEIPSGEATEVTFVLGAKLNVGETYYAAPVTAKVTTTSAEKVYPNVWVIGAYCGWSHDTSLYLWNYAEDGDVYMGVVDFQGKDDDGNDALLGKNGFKITPNANWDAEFGGTGTEDEEPASIPVVEKGGSDIKNYGAKRFYHFSLSTKKLTLSKNYSFDQVGVIGLNGDWDNDIVMNYSSYKQRFYVDVEVAAATEFKFRLDGGWDINFGGDKKALTNGGDNIAIEAGNYRIYFNMNNLDAISCSIDANAYGTEEGAPEGDEPEEELPEGARPVNILMKANDWTTANLYGWGGKLNFAWPGVAAEGVAELSGVKWNYWTLPAENWGATDMGLIFNNGDKVQTVDIKDFVLDGDKAFELGAADAEGKLSYTVVDAPVVKVTYANEGNWEAVNVYGWGSEGVEFSLGDWPGKAMTKEGDAWVYEFPAEHIGKNVNLIFNNGDGKQTVDITDVVFNGDKSFDNTNAAIKE